MILSHGHFSSSTAMIVSTTRITIAAALPQKMAIFCCFGGSERAASAITTALSPDRMMLIQMIEPSAAQKAAEVNSMQTPSPSFLRCAAHGRPRQTAGEFKRARWRNACGLLRTTSTRGGAQP